MQLDPHHFYTLTQMPTAAPEHGSLSTVWRKIRLGLLPTPIKHSPRKTGYYGSTLIEIREQRMREAAEKDEARA